jgi:hypothetical protein
MRPPILCRERLNRISTILSRYPDGLSVREFTRTFSVWSWELEQAAELGWVQIETCKPRTGRPSRVAKNVSETGAAKLPPYRWQIIRPISIRHSNFARIVAIYTVPYGCRFAGMALACTTDAYQKAFPAAKKRRAASASASRLLGHPDVDAARRWYHAREMRWLPRDEEMPATAFAIECRLIELNCWTRR